MTQKPEGGGTADIAVRSPDKDPDTEPDGTADGAAILRWDCDDSPVGTAIQPRWDCDTDPHGSWRGWSWSGACEVELQLQPIGFKKKAN